MRRGTSAQKNFEVLVRVFKAMITHERLPEDPGSPPTDETLNSFIEVMGEIIRRAEERSGLDLNENIDRDAFVLAAATVLYSPNDPGAKIKWDGTNLVRLVLDVEETRARAKRRISDSECCEELLKISPYKEMRFGSKMKPATIFSLRRQLSRGRRMLLGSVRSANI
jgi:hypothetical protein